MRLDDPMLGEASRVISCCPLEEIVTVEVSWRVGIYVGCADFLADLQQRGPPELAALHDTRPRPRLSFEFEPLAMRLNCGCFFRSLGLRNYGKLSRTKARISTGIGRLSRVDKIARRQNGANALYLYLTMGANHAERRCEANRCQVRVIPKEDKEGSTVTVSTTCELCRVGSDTCAPNLDQRAHECACTKFVVYVVVILPTPRALCLRQAHAAGRGEPSQFLSLSSCESNGLVVSFVAQSCST